MTFTYACINKARNISIYILGESKANTVEKALKGAYDPEGLPIQKIGTKKLKALWVLDEEAASKLEKTKC